MAERGAGFQRSGKVFSGTNLRKDDRVATGLSDNEPLGFERKDRKGVRKRNAKVFLCVLCEILCGPLRLNPPFDDHPSQIWKADV